MIRKPNLHLHRSKLLERNPEFVSRILKHVSLPYDHWDQCWTFGMTSASGYGVITAKIGNGRSTSLYAHRVMYAIQYGSIDGRVVKHECNQRDCVNPIHLQAGTQWGNIEDANWYKEMNKNFCLPGKYPHHGVQITPQKQFRFATELGLTEANLWLAERELQIIDLVDAA
jgi:hypothetical protein